MDEIVCLSPVDGREVARRRLASPAEIERALEEARRAQREWAQVPLDARCRVLGRFVEAMEALNPLIVPELAWQMGRPVRYSGEFRSLAERVKEMLALVPEALGPVGDPEAGRFVTRVPAGLVLVLAPWNYPFLTAANTIVPALLAGNAVLLKHAAQTPLAGERFAEALASAGLPEGLFHNLFLSHDDVVRLLASGRIDHATFTGSVAGGRAVERAAARRFTTLTLELGGKDAAYVRADAALDTAVEGLVDGSFYNSGQSCCGIERIYVEESVWDPFVDAFVAATELYRLGDPLDPETSLGPMASPRLAGEVRAQTGEALAAGAEAHVARQLFPADAPGTAWLMPQVLTGVDHGMRLMREETFGPVVGIMKVEGDEEALRLVNDSAYGLTASIWTQDLDAARRLAPRIEAGTVFANRCDYLDPRLAWTGVKDSGRGASLGRYGFDSVTRPRSFHLRSA
ncbi:aldehyde dehydrogenase family protein [Sphingomonas parva]|uniref:Aldehyde dehydrogenase family protein n=1 Tax=Sphingomonas parva TaxID=2555898 RepID=A0A4Y8ZNT5_9SPHN|nr:aldehyde dehydrogenase family protein [Sphingomonas parva]TFI57661.1 aldehyde dehydrogenase family protein [Sphingomonas parva]